MSNSKYYRWLVVLLLWFVAFLNYMDRQMLSTMKFAIEVDIQELKSAANFGYLMGVFLWVYAIVSPFAGAIADKLNRKWLIVSSLFVWSSVTLFMGQATTFNQLYWLRALMGVSEALYIPAGLALIVDYHQSKTRSLATGLHMTGLYMGQAIGGFGASIAAAYSWQATFHMFGIIGVAYSILLIFALKDRRPTIVDAKTLERAKKQPVIKTLKILFWSISFWIILFYFTIPSFPGWAVKNWLPTLVANNLDIEMSVAGPMTTITIATSSFLGVVFGGVISDRWIQKNVRGRVYTCAIGIALLIPALLLIGFGSTVIHLLSAAFCFGFGFGMFDANNMPIVCQFFSNKHRATAYGIMNMTSVFAGAIVTDFLGKSTDEGHLGRDFAILAGLVFLAIPVQLAFLRPKVKDVSDATNESIATFRTEHRRYTNTFDKLG